jgi:hypothetical protein
MDSSNIHILCMDLCVYLFTRVYMYILQKEKKNVQRYSIYSLQQPWLKRLLSFHNHFVG